MLDFNNASRIKKKKKKDANGCSEIVQNYTLSTHGPHVNILKDAVIFLDHTVHKRVWKFAF